MNEESAKEKQCRKDSGGSDESHDSGDGRGLSCLKE